MLTPQQIFFDDQYQAATAGVQQFMDQTAALTRSTLNATTSQWLESKFYEFRLALVARKVRYCPHITSAPMPAFTAASELDTLVCASCVPSVHGGGHSQQQCDRCGAPDPTIFPGCAAQGPILMSYGVCAPCVGVAGIPHPIR